jgi:molybdopterin converting factor small subunit
MTSMYRRYDMIGAINFWCSKNKLSYFTYIEKKTKAELEAIILKYDINVEELRAEQAKEREEAANIIAARAATIKKNIGFLVDKIAMLESLLNDEQKEKYEEYCNSQHSNL